MHIPEYGRRLHLATALHSSILLCYFFSTPLAADATPLTTEEPPVDTITITGSHLDQANRAMSNAVVTVTAEDIERSGALNVEETIRKLLLALPGISPGVNRANPGVATLNLRGLGDDRTLVLLDGKRLMPYSSGGAVDVNNIPTALLERIEVVTGGASAVYGSDAMAGVVNFILRRDFEGLQLNANLRQTEHGDGETRDVGLTFGRNLAGGRGNVVLFLGLTDRNAVYQGAREFSEFALTTATGQRGGVETDTQGTFFCSPNCFPAGGGAGGEFFVGFTPQGNLAPLNGRLFNYNPYNLLQVPQERIQSTALLNYDASDSMQVYGRASFTRSQVDSAIAPSGIFFLRSHAFPLSSPFFTAQSRQVLTDRVNNTTLAAGSDGLPDAQYDTNADGVIDSNAVVNAFFTRRTVETGLRINANRTIAWQGVTGLKGDLANGWRWDASFQYGSSELRREYLNDISEERFRASVAGCPPGSPTGCVAGNFFGDGNLSAEAARFIALNLSERIEVDQQVLSTLFGGTLASLAIPGAAPVDLALGAEHRREKSASFPDDCLSTSGCSAGYGLVRPVRNRYDVTELFGEVRIPLLEERSFAHRLDFDTGLRLSDYSTVGRVNAFKAGLEWAPVSASFEVRALYQRAVRAPNIFEFGSPTQPSRDTGTDLCAGGPGGVVSDELRALCIATGVPASAFTGNVSSVPTLGSEVNIFTGGNPDLNEERSDTFTTGFVWTPQPGLSAQLYWYRIDIEDAITTLSASQTLQACYSTALNPDQSPDSAICGLIHRNPDTGGLSDDPAYGVSQRNENIAFLKTSGIDAQLDYTLETARGSLRFSLLGTYVIENERKATAELPTRDCVGEYGAICGSPNPQRRFTQAITWNIGAFDLGYRWRYLAGTHFDDSSSAIEAFRRIPAYHYVDLSFGWKPTQFAGLRLTVGIDNLLDKDPPLVGEDAGPALQNSGNTYPGTFDTLGRSFFASVAKTF